MSLGLRRAPPNSFYWLKKAFQNLDLDLDFSDREYSILSENSSETETEPHTLSLELCSPANVDCNSALFSGIRFGRLASELKSVTSKPKPLDPHSPPVRRPSCPYGALRQKKNNTDLMVQIKLIGTVDSSKLQTYESLVHPKQKPG
ncbi:hypothetical protein BgiMline_032567 [Biomphalaria glabrata]